MSNSQESAWAGLLVDATSEVGLDFVHFNGMSGRYYFSEMMGAGGALLDYDGDGDLDLYLIQGSVLEPGASPTNTTFPPAPGAPLTDRLYRNDLARGSDGVAIPAFVDVTEDSGIVAQDYGMGAATGDYNNDGWVDLYITNFGPNRLLRNNGDGTFSDATVPSGTAETRWSVPALFFDYDRDGWLDLYAGNYVDYSIATHFACFSDLGERDYCGPLSSKPLTDRLYRNLGDGTFEDTTGRSGLSSEPGRTLGAVAADFNDDGWLDLYVANDGMPNYLWINQHDGTFRNQALMAGTAVNEDGNPEASMGAEVADFDHDGDEDLFLTHLSGETNTLYANLGGALFHDMTHEAGLGALSLRQTGFGAAWRDLNGDGWLDLVVVNGAVSVIPELLLEGDPLPLRQKNQLFVGGEGGRYTEVSAPALAPETGAQVSRALLTGDLDNDGDLDFVIANNSGPARVLLNQGSMDSRWLGLRMVAGASAPGGSATGGSASGNPPRDILGTRVSVALANGRVLVDRVGTDGSYASANDPRLVFGLRPNDRVDEVRAVWVNGVTEAWSDLELNTYTTLRRGSGRAFGEQRP